MNLKNALLLFIYSHLFVLGSFAQNNNLENLHPKIAVFALEVYNDLTEYQTYDHLLIYSNNIKRVKVEKENLSSFPYPSLKDVGLRSKYNSNLTIDKDDFIPENFNPLKYFFNYYSKEIQKFRVGNSGYIIIIEPFQD